MRIMTNQELIEYVENMMQENICEQSLVKHQSNQRIQMLKKQMEELRTIAKVVDSKMED